jgi:maltokinase
VNLGESVARADPAVLLPALRRGEQDRLALPLRVVDALALSAVPTGDDGALVAGWSTLLSDAAGTLLGVPLVPDADTDGAVRRAVPGDGAAVALLEVLRAGIAVAPFEAVRLRDVTATGERGLRPEVDQTHESVVVGDTAGEGSTAVVVKWSVHVEAVPATPPAVAAARHLDAVGFTQTPEPVGFLVHHVGGEPAQQVLLASVTRFLAGALDGWDWYVDDLLAWLGGAPADAVAPAAAMGDLVARMHLAFATPWSAAPRPVVAASEDDVERWVRRALNTIAAAATDTAGEAGDRFRRRADAARAVVTDGLSEATGTVTTRVHGDLHVGQVLRWSGGYAVSDFDGNPVLPAAERDRPQPPARDVAGLLRGIDHVGRIVDRRTRHASADRVRGWSADARDAFLSAYRAGIRGGGHPGLLDERLLPAFEVEQECRELVYAARHLPRWTYVPDAALAELLPLPGEEV